MTKTPFIIQKIFYKWIWKIPTTEKKIYLTFDDGPIPDVTIEVLNILQKENIKATFFCIGDNIKKHPTVFKKIIEQKHTVGNHTFNHLNGWKTATKNYVDNVVLCEKEIFSQSPNHPISKLFRPPYGRISLLQAYKLRKLNYKIIMWEILSKDYDSSITEEECLQNVLRIAKNGSIIVFHDSLKAKKNMLYSLQKTITYFKNLGYQFDVLT